MIDENDCPIKPTTFWDILFLSKRLRLSIAIVLVLTTIFIGIFFITLAWTGCDFEFGWPNLVKIYNCNKK